MSDTSTLCFRILLVLCSFIACAAVAMAQDVTSKATVAASGRKQALDVAALDRQRIFKLADQALGVAPISITQFPAKLSEGGPHDFYSNGDYWWPDPTKPGGLP